MKMYLSLSLNSDAQHERALEETGYWGRAGAGCIVQCAGSGRILLPLRSKHVEEPLTWGTWGGAIDSGESAKEAVLRELREEAGYSGKILDMVQLYVFRDKSFTYTTFLITVPREFRPQLNWETLRSKWFDLDNLPHNLHNGLKAILADSNAQTILRKGRT